MKSLYNVTLNPSLSSEDKAHLLGMLAITPKFHVGNWVLVHFLQDETGKHQKLLQPWHSSYRIASRDDPGVTVIKMYFPEDPQI